MLLSTEAIVLHSRKFGDTSRIVVLYTRDHGKVSVVAKGVRKPSSPFGSALEPLGHTRVTLYFKRGRDLHTVSAAESITPRRRIRDSYDHLQTALAVCELLLRTQADEERNDAVFDLLCDGLNAVEDTHDPYATGVAIRLRLADVMGFGVPDCGPPPPNPAVAVDMGNGMLRPEALAGTGGVIRMSSAAYGVLHSCLGDASAISTTVSPADRLELESFLSLYFSHHLDKRVSGRTYDVMK